MGGVRQIGKSFLFLSLTRAWLKGLESRARARALGLVREIDRFSAKIE
jgi:hypothetical protein